MSKTVVGIIMGSQSDLKVMKAAAEVLEELGIGYELTIVSAQSAHPAHGGVCI